MLLTESLMKLIVPLHFQLQPIQYLRVRGAFASAILKFISRFKHSATGSKLILPAAKSKKHVLRLLQLEL